MKRLRWMSLLLVLGLAACSARQDSQSVPAIPVPTATRAGEPGNAGFAQPVTAEEALYVFLTAYENNPDEMFPFLSPALQENLPPGGISELLGFKGTLEGLVFASGTTATNPNLAVVEARLQIGGEEVLRVFYLERQGENWLITAVEREAQ